MPELEPKWDDLDRAALVVYRDKAAALELELRPLREAASAFDMRLAAQKRALREKDAEIVGLKGEVGEERVLELLVSGRHLTE